MSKWFDNLIDMFSRGIPTAPIPAGMYHYQSPPDAELPFRLHLRVEPEGNGILIVNAHTTLHLNQTAAEYAYYLIQGYDEEQVVSEVNRRYLINPKEAAVDYKDFVDKVHSLASTEDIDPVIYLGIDRKEPYPHNISAPYRLDCAITYDTSDQQIINEAPKKRVTRELLTDEWRRILLKSWQSGIPQVIFTGGEPTLRPDLPDLIAYTQSIGQVSGLLTDGYRLADRDYMHRLLNSGLDHVMVMLDIFNERSWDCLHVAIAEDIFLTVHLTITSANAEKLSEAIDRLKDIGVTHLSLTTQDTSLKAKLKYLTDYASARDFKLIWDIPVPYSAFNIFNLESDEDSLPEGAGTAWLYVEPDGDVLPAQGVNHVMGNLLADDWQSIWSKRPGAKN